MQKLPNSQSLLELASGAARIYVRYSKPHQGGRTFFGLRKSDLQALEGHCSYLCFLWDGQEEPLLLPYATFEDVFDSIQPANDGQYKVQIYHRTTTELYVARVGRFNVNAHFGWDDLDRVLQDSETPRMPELSHAQVQTLLGSIGALKGYDLWIPQNDRERLDWTVAKPFRCRERLPKGYERVGDVVRQVDVVWVERGSDKLTALYEVEHSTSIYSGLLRSNDVHLAAPRIDRMTIVADEERHSAFGRQLNKPTFQASGLSEICAFMEYRSVYRWHRQIQGPKEDP